MMKMDKGFVDYVKGTVTPFNDDVCRGLAYKQSPEIPGYVDLLINRCSEFFPEGLTFDGSERATPKEHFDRITQPQASKRSADIARYDYFMMKYHFTFAGEKLPPICILLPYIGEGNTTVHRDAKYVVSPAMCDIGYSVVQGKIFIQLARSRYIFNKQHHQVLRNNVAEMGYVYHAPIHHEVRKTAGKSQYLKGGRSYIHTTLAHYLFAKYGFLTAVKKFTGADVVVKLQTPEDKALYPRDKYDAFTSCRLSALPHPNAAMTIYVKKEDMRNNGAYLTTMCASYFYVFDAFADEFDELSDVNVPSFWQRLLGSIIKGDHEHRGIVLKAMEDHMESTDTQLDNTTREALHNRGVYVNDMYEFFSEIMSNLSDLFIQTSAQGSREASAYGKRLVVKRYLMEEINTACTSIAQRFQSESSRGKVYRSKDIMNILTAHFKLNMCVHNLNRHGEVNLLTIPNCSMIHQATAMVVDQEEAGRRDKSSRAGLINDPKQKLHASLAEVFSYSNCPKRAATGRGRINPTVKLTPSGCIQRKEHLKPMLDEVQRKLDER